MNPIAYQNQEVVYNILFKAAAETLTELSSYKKYLGAQIGITEVLHTWAKTWSTIHIFIVLYLVVDLIRLVNG